MVIWYGYVGYNICYVKERPDGSYEENASGASDLLDVCVIAGGMLCTAGIALPTM